MTDILRLRTQFFFVLAAAICMTAVVLSGMLPNLARAEAVAIGITLDLALLVPLAYYFLVVRPRGWPLVALAPVIVLSLLLASVVVPAEHQQVLRVVKALAIPVEIGLLGWIAWQAARALRQVRHSGASDPLEEIHRSAKTVLRMRRPADVLASELAVLFYAVGAWRSPPHHPETMRAFTSHRRSGHGGLVFAVLLLMLIEGVVVHILLFGWSPTAAWIAAFLGFYGALWVIADYRATVLRPHLASEAELWIRAGLRWRARIPRQQIVSVERVPPKAGESVKALTFLMAPNLWIQFSAPVDLEGPYGIRRGARALGLFVDEPAEFQRLLGNRAP